MARLGLLLCALVLSGCNALLPGISGPQASAPASPPLMGDQVGSIVAPPLADLDCAPRAGAISCN